MLYEAFGLCFVGFFFKSLCCSKQILTISLECAFPIVLIQQIQGITGVSPSTQNTATVTLL